MSQPYDDRSREAIDRLSAALDAKGYGLPPTPRPPSGVGELQVWGMWLNFCPTGKDGHMWASREAPARRTIIDQHGVAACPDHDDLAVPRSEGADHVALFGMPNPDDTDEWGLPDDLGCEW